MNKERELLRQALEAWDNEDDVTLIHEVLEEIRTYLSTTSDDAEEPFGYVSQHGIKGVFELQFNRKLSDVYRDTALSITPVYAHPPRPEPVRKPMTEEEIWSAYRTSEDRESFFDGVRYAEKHHKIGDNRE